MNDSQLPSQFLALPADEARPLSPLDGRYRAQSAALTEYLSEDAINRLRLHIEVEWLIFVSENEVVTGPAPLKEAEKAYLRSLPANYTADDRDELARFEEQTRHDVKAVEYLLRQRALDGGLERWSEAIHLFATSDDINNLAIALAVKGAVTDVWLPAARTLRATIRTMSTDLADTPMLARTHGQSATPTTVGKELAVFGWRLEQQMARIVAARYSGKFNGATGTFSAHTLAAPHADWAALSRAFVESLGLTWNPLTTQIESHDWQARLYDDIAHFNRVCHNLATDMWTYISLGYFRQQLSAQGSTGSSTMPHKVNPIRFENAEANLEVSNALLQVLSANLSTSRLQRDLSDSSLQRNIGVAIGYSLVALDNLTRGLQGVSAAEDVLRADLSAHWEVISEGIQQVMRVAALRAASGEGPDSPPSAGSLAGDRERGEGAPGNAGEKGPYELLKELTRGRQVTQADMERVIASAGLPEDLREALRSLSPETYVGLAPQLAQMEPGSTNPDR